MQNSNLGIQKWMIAIYLMSTRLQDVASMNCIVILAPRKKADWYLVYRIQETWNEGHDLFTGPVEIDGMFIGGKRKIMSNAKRKELKDTG